MTTLTTENGLPVTLAQSPLLPVKVHRILKDACNQAQATLRTMSAYPAPPGAGVRKNYGLRVDYGNCVVNLTIELT